MSELYTIDRTPSTDLEKFQALRIEALERELQKQDLIKLLGDEDEEREK